MSFYCQKCQTATAKVHVTELKEGKKIEHHFCEECAETQGIAPKAAAPVSMYKIFKELMEKGGAARRSRDRQCPECGMTFSEFKAKGRFGCPHDYDVFLSRLIPLLQRIHGASQQDGLPPEDDRHEDLDLPEQEQADEENQAQVELEELKTELQRVVQREQYEEAARIRDRIKELEETLTQGGGA